MQCPVGLLLSSCAALGWLLHSSVLSFLIYKCGYSRGSPAGRGASSDLVVRLSSDQRWVGGDVSSLQSPPPDQGWVERALEEPLHITDFQR